MNRSGYFGVAALVSLLALSTISCNKNDSPAPPGSGGGNGGTGSAGSGMKVSLLLPGGDIANCELIISERTGKVLLDSVAPPTSTINAMLNTSDTLVDVSLVLLPNDHAFLHQIKITTYKAVNPGSWKSLGGTFQPYWGSPVKSVAASTKYRDAPSYDGVQFSTTAGSGGGFDYSPTLVLTVSYQTVPGSSTYLLFPWNRFYIVRTPTSLIDTVLCDTLRHDTAVATNLNSAPNYSLISTNLLGVDDTNNIYAATRLYYWYDNGQTGPTQLMYPRDRKFQKYLLESQVSASPDNKQKLYDYEYTGAITNTINYPPANAFVIGTAQNNSFTVTFRGSKPASYQAVFTNNAVNWQFYASPDSTSLNPLALLTAQKSKLLQGQDLSGIQVNSFVAELVPGYSYGAYMGLLNNAALLSTTHLASYSMYTKSY